MASLLPSLLISTHKGECFAFKFIDIIIVFIFYYYYVLHFSQFECLGDVLKFLEAEVDFLNKDSVKLNILLIEWTNIGKCPSHFVADVRELETVGILGNKFMVSPCRL